MTATRDCIDVPEAKEGEAFAGDFPTVRGTANTEPSWVALSALVDSVNDNRVRSVSAAAMAGAFIRSMRKAACLSQVDLAKVSGIRQPVISDIERGVGALGPSFETMFRLAKACGMEIGFAEAGAVDGGTRVQGRNVVESQAG